METFNLILIILLTVLTLIPFFLLVDLFFPRKIEQIQQAAVQRRGHSFLLGLVNFLFFGALSALFFGIGENTGLRFVSLIGLLILLLLAVGLVLGLTAVARIVSQGLFPETAPPRQKTWGIALLILACLAPFVGWFGFLPFAGLLGLGALIGGWFQRRKTPQSELAVPPEEDPPHADS